MRLIILDDTEEREGYRAAVKSNFPELTVHAFSKEEDIGDLIEEADILFTRKISDGSYCCLASLCNIIGNLIMFLIIMIKYIRDMLDQAG